MQRKLFILFILVVISGSCEKNAGEAIDSLEDVMINGQMQKILIQGNTAKPVILYLHGGPGYSSILESNAFTDLLRKECIFVQWDQRGTGYSYSETADSTKMSMTQLIEDTKVLTDYLRKRFDRKKIFLAGHSWGSALGFYTIEQYPEKYHAFIGAGQVVNRKAHINARIDWVREKMKVANDTLGLAQLNENIESNAGFIFKYGGFMHTMVNVDSVVKLSPYYSKSYSDLLEKGAEFSAKHIPEQEQNRIDLTKFKSTQVPIYFFLGRYDQLAPTSFPESFLASLVAPDKKLIWFESSGHLMMLEEPRKFQEEVLKIVKRHR